MSFRDWFNGHLIKKLDEQVKDIERLDCYLGNASVAYEDIDGRVDSLNIKLKEAFAEIQKLKAEVDNLKKNQLKDNDPIDPDKYVTLTFAIYDILKNAKNELHHKDIIAKLSHYNIRNKNPSYASFKGTLSYLKKLKKVENGKNYGSYKINRKSE